MQSSKFCFLIITAITMLSVTSCSSQDKSGVQKNNSKTSLKANMKTSNTAFTEGKDYSVFTRARILDKAGFSQPVEAFSLLIPKTWKFDGDIIWNGPGESCAGTNKRLKATSPDGKYSFEMFPDYTWGFNTDHQVAQFNQNTNSPYCGYGEPLDAGHYLAQVYAPQELGNPQLTDIKANEPGAKEMKQSGEKFRQELMSYGASQVMFYSSAINAKAKWNDGSEGLIICGVIIIESTIPNVYNGTYSKIYTSTATERILFKYPASASDKAAGMLSVIMSSVRTNGAWKNSVNAFWADVRQKKQIAHVGRIKMMDDLTRQIGENTIRKGKQNLNDMDANMRNWEASQQSQDRTHTNFVKAIREVENYRDETGKVELSSGYNHAWSRSDGSSFIMSDNPNFDPSSVFQDQQWKEMKKVD